MSSNYLSNDYIKVGYNQNNFFTDSNKLSQKLSHSFNFSRFSTDSSYQNIPQQSIKVNDINDSSNDKPIISKLLKNITYSINSFIHIPFPQQKVCCDDVGDLLYSKTAFFSEDKLTVTYSTSGNLLPHGVYPRRILSYFTKYVTRKKLKHSEIPIPTNKLRFLREVLSINYVPGSRDIRSVNAQLQAFAECLTTIKYSNFNDKSRKNRVDFKFFASDVSFLWDDSKEWQPTVTLSEDFFELIKHNTVPISEEVMLSRNALKIDLINYLLYQNYNLQRKELSCRFNFSELQSLFASTSIFHEFRTIVKGILKILENEANLDIKELTKESFLMVGSKNATLYRPNRRKTNPDPNAKIKLSQEQIQRLEALHGKVEVDSAVEYLETIQKNGNDIRNPFSYIKDVLCNPKWYAKHRIANEDKYKKKAYALWTKESESTKNLVKEDLINRIKITPPDIIKHSLRNYFDMLRAPGMLKVKDMPFDFKYVVFMYANKLRGGYIKTSCIHEQMMYQLFDQLLRKK